MRWIEWMFDHVFVVIAVATIIASWLNKLRSSRGRDELHQEAPPEERPPQMTRRVAEEVPDLASDIQEEIRRKIAERRGDAGIPPVLLPEEPPQATREISVTLRQRLERKLAQVREREEAAIAASKRRKLEVEARAFEAEQKEDELARAAVQHAPQPRFPTTVVGAIHPMLAGLREPASLRRAIVLREVIGPPLSLR